MTLADVKELADSLEGSSVLNIYLLSLLGGQITINKEAMLKVAAEFSRLDFSLQDDNLTIKLKSSQGGVHDGTRI